MAASFVGCKVAFTLAFIMTVMIGANGARCVDLGTALKKLAMISALIGSFTARGKEKARRH